MPAPVFMSSVLRRPMTSGELLHRVALLLLLLSISSTTCSADKPVRYFQVQFRHEYGVQLLRLALSKVDPDYRLEPTYDYQRREMTESRGMQSILTKDTDVFFLATNQKREELFRPIRIPIMQGILGFRVFIIRREDQSRFDQISTKEELQRLVAGFGSQWADRSILEHNQFPLRTSPVYESLFAMLNAKRFDYFPRGINEAWKEIDHFKTHYPDLTVEKRLALYYPYPVYFFVHRDNIELAEAIESGLNKALADGSFKELFLSYHREYIEQANLNERVIFELDNPYLSPGTPHPDTSWWFSGQPQPRQ